MTEFYDERWRRLGIEPKITRYTDDGVWYGQRRNALYFMPNPATELRTCELCGKTSTPKKVQCRNDVYGWDVDKNDFTKKSKHILCMSCWNKVRPLVKKQDEFNDLMKLQRKILREVKKHEANN